MIGIAKQQVNVIVEVECKTEVIMNLKKMTLNINGAHRTFICDPAKDTLASVLRRLGLTGTKVGCGTGVCGACSVILNGEVIRSCTRRIKTVQENSSVITIEGIGTVMNPHPLQSAWVSLGIVQCGFCAPGFIVSAYQLLQENPDPTREEARDWFQKHRNVCRCTGYKQIVDAVMEAAAVMRGEKNPEAITCDPDTMAKVCGVCDYGDDIELKMPSGTLHAVPVMPMKANHAKILEIDINEAEKMPGVVKIITARDIPDSHNLLQNEKIVRWGDPVAIVVADTKDRARSAADKVHVDLDPLPEMMSYVEAVQPDAYQVYPSIDNVYSRQTMLKGNHESVPSLIQEAYCSVEGSFYSPRNPHMSIEGDTVQSFYDEDGKLCIQCRTIPLYFDKENVAASIGISAEDLRVIENPTGDSFRQSIGPASYALCGAATKVTGAPVALSMTYAEFMALSGKGSPSYINGRLACDESGKLVAGEFDAGLDNGPYPEIGENNLSEILSSMFFPYQLPNVSGLARSAVTNHNFGVPYRGYGAPQAYTASEALVDMLAEKMEIDPFEFRYRNIQDSMKAMMDRLKPIYDEAAARAKAEDTPEIRKGIGLAWGGYALFMAEVSVETATGKTTVDRMTCIDRADKEDTIPSDGQTYGDISHAIGFALSENYENVKKHNNIFSAGVPYIKDIPDDMTVIHMDDGGELSGSSAASEGFQSYGHMAVINAISNAAGVRIYELPASPDKVKEGIDTLARGEAPNVSKKYFLGSDLYEELENIKG